MFRIIAIAALAMELAAAETKVPKEATLVEPGVYKHTDTTGKTFLYRKTPFGIVKSAEQKAEQKAEPKTEAATATPFGPLKASKQPDRLKVVDRGDLLEFERPSPFGSYKWKRKKTELTEAEREAWESTLEQSAPATGPKE